MEHPPTPGPEPNPDETSPDSDEGASLTPFGAELMDDIDAATKPDKLTSTPGAENGGHDDAPAPLEIWEVPGTPFTEPPDLGQ